MKSIQCIKRETAERLTAYYPPDEAEAISRILVEEIGGKPYPSLVLEAYKLTEKELATLSDETDRLLRHEPLGQVIGRAWFGDLPLKVTRRTLIPRPETEELCERIVSKGWLASARTALDVGTGTGAIALFLKSRAPQVEVHALEIDPETLAVAEGNARNLALPVRFHLGSILDGEPLGAFDLVVSNPPYILPSEREEMMPHVLEYEPHGALFVPKEDPILFYRAILERLGSDMSSGSRIALELNPLTAENVEALYREAGFRTELSRDLYGKVRFLFAEKTD